MDTGLHIKSHNTIVCVIMGLLEHVGVQGCLQGIETYMFTTIMTQKLVIP